MIPNAFEYHRPDTAAQAVEAFGALRAAGRRPMYYGGGTEIISLARTGQLDPGAVVDLKAVPECRALGPSDGHLAIGAARTLAELDEARAWPLLGDAAGRVADHSTRCKITFGGNIAGSIPYREAVLPLLLLDCEAVVAGPQGLRTVPFDRVFDGRLRLAEGEFLAQVRVDRADLRLPHACVKRTRLDWVDYPLLTVAAVRKNGRLRAAFSGLCAAPFRSARMEDELNGGGGADERAERAVRQIPSPVVDDLHGSADYRRFVLTNTLADIIDRLQGA